jgi:catechol 2,3-dioxygenase
VAEHLISQLSHVEVMATDIDASVDFYTNLLGFSESGREGQSVYLRGWGEHFYGTIKLTEGQGPALGHFGWRTEGPEELETVVARLEALGVGEGWIDGDASHGPAFRFRTPSGHLSEVHWDVTWHTPTDADRSAIMDRAQRYDPRGAFVRQIDHVALASTDVAADRDFFVRQLNFKFREGIFTPGEDSTAFLNMISCRPYSHDVALILQPEPGVQHLALWVDGREDVLRASDVIRESGRKLQEGPATHALGQNFYLYVQDPSGMTVEIYTEQRAFYQPDRPPYEWVGTSEGLKLRNFEAHRHTEEAARVGRGVSERTDPAGMTAALKDQ